MDECDLLVYRLYGIHHWTADCEDHEWTEHSLLFSDAIGRAMLHRGAAIR